jgi:hypothetical protein
MREHPDGPKEAVHTRRNNVIRNIIRGVIFFIVFIAACGYFILALIFNGGIDGLISNLKPEPNPGSSAMNAKRKAATEEIDQSFAESQNILHYNYYETATHDHCSRGSNSWKRSDGYAYRCSLRITKFYGFNGDFRQQMIDFEQNIISIGWESPSWEPDRPMKKMLEEYYDHYTTYQSGDLIVSNLPGFECKYGKDGLSLELAFAERKTHSFIHLNAIQEVSGHSFDEIYDEKNFYDSSSVVKKITDTDGFVLVISIQKSYFQN